MNRVKQTPEDAFYENLTLGLTHTLSHLPRVCDLQWERRSPCEKSQLINWEQRHCVYLPDDMKKFYLSTDGFALYWSFVYEPGDVRRVGAVEMPHLLQITLLRENVDSTLVTYAQNTNATSQPASPSVESLRPRSSSSVNATGTGTGTGAHGRNITLVLTPKTKLFEIKNVNNVAKVCLVYECTGTSNPKIYLLELQTLAWRFLAETFTEYLRMAIAHLGLPQWELCFSKIELPYWIMDLFLFLAPNLLRDHPERSSTQVEEVTDYPHNVIDANVFRARPKGKSHTTNSGMTNKNKQQDSKCK